MNPADARQPAVEAATAPDCPADGSDATGPVVEAPRRPQAALGPTRPAATGTPQTAAGRRLWRERGTISGHWLRDSILAIEAEEGARIDTIWRETFVQVQAERDECLRQSKEYLAEAALLARPVEPRYREALERIARADISQHVRNIVRSALGDDTPEPPRPSRVFDDGGMDL